MFDKDISQVNYKDINILLYEKQQREDQHLDYKRDFYKNAKDCIKDITAFANANGGFIIFGIDEKKNLICGIDDKIKNTKIEDWITNVLNTGTDITPNYKIHFIPFINDDDLKSHIVILEVSESKVKPIYHIENTQSNCYIRRGSSIFPIKPIELREMMSNKTESGGGAKIVTLTSTGNHNAQIGINQGNINISPKINKITKVHPNAEDHISQEQNKNISQTVNDIITILEDAGKINNKDEKSKAFREWNGKFNRKFKITNRLLFPKEKYEEAIMWLRKQHAIQTSKLRRTNNAEWRNKRYKGIYSKLRELGFPKEKAYEIANSSFQLKEPTTSLKDLGEQNLDKLYTKIMSLKK